MIAFMLKYKSVILKGMEEGITVSQGRRFKTLAILKKHIQQHNLRSGLQLGSLVASIKMLSKY